MPEERTAVDIKSFIKEVAESQGFDGNKAFDIAERLIKEKCYDIQPYQPYDGATSFAEIDSQMAGMDYAAKANEATYALQGIINNITSDMMMSTDEKATKMAQAITDYKDRVDSIQAGGKDFFGRVKDWFVGEKRNYSKDQRDSMASSGEAMSDGSFPIKDATDLSNAIHAVGRASDPISAKAHIKKRARALGKTSMLPDGWKETESNSFKVYTDSEGKKRWMSTSSNAFEDLDKELFTTEALQEAIDYADKEDARGPLLVYHVPSAEIGQCDFQAMAGRFLVESGTFDDTPLGRKALEYFENTDEEHQVSIGFQYIMGDEKDGQYDWLRINERSTTPFGAAANPWTDFKLVLGDSKVNEQKAAHLRKIFGDDLANSVIAGAEEKTKELEQSVRFKEKVDEYDEKEFGPITDVVELKTQDEVPVVSHEHGKIKHTHRVAWDSEHVHTDLPAFKAKKKPAADAEDAADGGADDDQEDANGKKKPPFAKKETELAELLATLVEDVGTIRDTVVALDGEVKSLKDADKAAKERENNTPRYDPRGQTRPSENASNVVASGKELDDVLNQQGEEIEKNPAFAYVQDLLGTSNGARSNS